MSENEDILKIKYRATKEQINKCLFDLKHNSHIGGIDKRFIDILKSSKHSLGQYWGDLFSKKGLFSDSAFNQIVKYQGYENVLSYIVDNAPEKFFYITGKNSPLVMVARNYQDIALKILNKMKPENNNQNREIYELALIETIKYEWPKIVLIKELANRLGGYIPSQILIQAIKQKYLIDKENLLLSILERIDPQNKNNDKRIYKKALSYAQEKGFSRLISALEQRLDYTPRQFVSSNITQYTPIAVNLPNPEQAIESAINTGDLRAALQIDDEALVACTKFFETFQNLYVSTIKHAEDARQNRMMLEKNIEKMQESLRSMMIEIDPSDAKYDSATYFLWSSVRKYIPWFDPRRILSNENIQITASTTSSLNASYQLIEACQKFTEAAPLMLNKIQALRSEYEEALTKIDNELESDLSEGERKKKTQLKSIFERSLHRMVIMAGTLAKQDLVNPHLLDTEIEFASGLKDSMLSFATSASVAISSMALVKMGMTEDMRHEVYESLSSQWDEGDRVLRLIQFYGPQQSPANDRRELPQLKAI